MLHVSHPGLRCGAIPREHQPGPPANPEGTRIPCPNSVPISASETDGHDAGRK